MGLACGDIKSGLLVGAVFSPIIGLPIGMLMGVNDQLDETSLGHKLEDYMDNKHDEYVEENNIQHKTPYLRRW